jgi:hypothetical protein
LVNLKTNKTKNRKEKKRAKQGHIYNPLQKITKLVVVTGNRGYKKNKK